MFIICCLYFDLSKLIGQAMPDQNRLSKYKNYFTTNSVSFFSTETFFSVTYSGKPFLYTG